MSWFANLNISEFPLNKMLKLQFQVWRFSVEKRLYFVGPQDPPRYETPSGLQIKEFRKQYVRCVRYDLQQRIRCDLTYFLNGLSNFNCNIFTMMIDIKVSKPSA